MDKRLFTIAVFFVLALAATGQGKTIGGLKTGFWTEKFEDAYHNYTLSGNYKIIPLSSFETIGTLGDNCYEVKYKGSTPLVFFEEKANGKISVKDSIWKSYDLSGRLVEVNYWINGLNEWTKYYDEKGNLVRHDYDDFDNDTSFQLTYINGQLFKKAFYPPENKNRQTEIYYPDNSLIISNAELFFHVDFLTKPSTTEKIVLSSKDDLTITSIVLQNQFINLTTSADQPLVFPLRLSCHQPFVIKISAAPTAADYKMKDTLSITTNESKTPYKIYSNIRAYHIDGHTVTTTATIELSKTKDKYLILPSMGTVTDAEIISKSGVRRFYRISNITRIDLSGFLCDTYDLLISSCNTGGKLKLTLTE